MCTPTPPQIFQAMQYAANVYPLKIADGTEENLLDLTKWLVRFTPSFYEEALEAGTKADKELRAYHLYDEKKHNSKIDFNAWKARFQSVIDQARVISLQR